MILSEQALHLTLLKAPSASSELIGKTYSPTTQPPWSIGRAVQADVVISDSSVSRSHARIEQHQQRWCIVNTSSNNGLYLNATPIAPGQSAWLSTQQTAHLQVGKVLLRLDWSNATEPYNEPLELPAQPSDPLSYANATTQDPFLRIARDGDCCVVYCKGKRVDLKPSSALALYALGQRPGQIIHTWDILDIVARELDLTQAISGARRGIKELLAQGEISRDELEGAILATSAHIKLEELQDIDDAALIRHLIFSRRGHGYGLALPAEWIETSSED